NPGLTIIRADTGDLHIKTTTRNKVQTVNTACHIIIRSLDWSWITNPPLGFAFDNPGTTPVHSAHPRWKHGRVHHISRTLAHDLSATTVGIYNLTSLIPCRPYAA